MDEYLTEYINLGLFFLICLCVLAVVCLLFCNIGSKKSKTKNQNLTSLKETGDKSENFQLHFNYWIEFSVLFLLFLFFSLYIPFFARIKQVSLDVFLGVFVTIFFIISGFVYFIKVLEKEKNKE